MRQSYARDPQQAGITDRTMSWNLQEEEKRWNRVLTALLAVALVVASGWVAAEPLKRKWAHVCEIIEPYHTWSLRTAEIEKCSNVQYRVEPYLTRNRKSDCDAIQALK
jgi:hypothetical protein